MPEFTDFFIIYIEKSEKASYFIGKEVYFRQEQIMGAKLAVGYQEPRNGEFFHEIVADHRESVEEVYFAWSNTPS